MTKSELNTENLDNPKNRRRQLPNAAGMRILEALAGRPQKILTENSELSESVISDYMRRGIVKTDAAITIARILGVNLDWLLTGNGPMKSGATSVAPASSAEWVDIAEFDLRKIEDHSLGDPVSRTPFRRDWLYNALGETSGIWITKMIAFYPAANLAEGAAVFCKNVKIGEPLVEKALYLFRINGGIVTARFTFRDAGILMAGDRIGEEYVTAGQIGTDDDQYTVVARIIGVLARPI